ncbi:MarR family winged helix-turn-helix transcriptional regulator [Nitrosococcus oceani]|uniref:MarR family winged helix-turn-helix transcriptional regulator n=1 Tax=Nitrosococcus oceani TaxID=1229 RepID=UPI0004E98148|nr:MarR family winged helix-turn-helix transcriptional regulator [Nitrosococcus oceani]KFI23152.1 MarR family transcriptional regulator [Nitrosococcus oceani]
MDKQKLFQLLERVGTLLRAEERKSATTLNLHPAHLQVLRYLAQCNRYSDTPMAVSEYLGTTKGTTSQSLLVLQRQGYLRKKSDPKDRRVVHLELTPKGRALTRKLALLANKEKTLAGLATAELQVTQQVLERLLCDLQKANHHRTFGQCHTCRYLLTTHDKQLFRCGLTQELLRAEETLKICQDHAFPSSSRSLEIAAN